MLLLTNKGLRLCTQSAQLNCKVSKIKRKLKIKGELFSEIIGNHSRARALGDKNMDSISKIGTNFSLSDFLIAMRMFYHHEENLFSTR